MSDRKLQKIDTVNTENTVIHMKKRLGDDVGRHAGLQQEPEDQHVRDEEQVHHRHEALARQARGDGRLQRRGDQRHDERAEEQPRQVLRATADAERVTQRQQHVVRRQQEEEVQEGPQQGADFPGLGVCELLDELFHARQHSPPSRALLSQNERRQVGSPVHGQIKHDHGIMVASALVHVGVVGRQPAGIATPATESVMTVKVAVVKETRPHERRVALVPAVADKLRSSAARSPSRPAPASPAASPMPPSRT